MLPTLLAAAGDPDVSQKLLNGYKAGDKTFRVHIDGINLLPWLTGQTKESPRESFFYVSDDGGIMARRHNDWKLVFQEQHAVSTRVWSEPMVKLRLPLIFNLRRDPFERAEFNSNTYCNWWMSHFFLLYGRAGDSGGTDRGRHQIPATPEGSIVQPRHGDGPIRAGDRSGKG